MRDLRFGIEIEIVGLSRQDIARAIQSVVGGTQYDSTVVDVWGRTWRVVSDASLSGGPARSGEIVSPILTYQDLTLLQDVVRAVRAAGGRSDESTGIHYARAVVMRISGGNPRVRGRAW